ncbi:43474_t:CDS:2, partial [Gigaspora margarita]
YNSTIQNLLPKLPELPNFENIKPIQQNFPIKILIKPFKIIGFNISAQSDTSYEILEKPSIFLQPLEISINYIYDWKFYGMFILNDITKLRLEFASSTTKDNDIFVASLQVIEGESPIHLSSIINTLLDENNEWSNKTPEEMKLLKFFVSTEIKAYFHINLAEKSVALYAILESIGKCLLLVKNLNEKPLNAAIEPQSIVKKFGYLLTIKINDFKFEKLFKPSNIVSVIDKILSLTWGNLVFALYQSATFENNIINELNDILNLDNEDKFEDIISIKLPDCNDKTLVQGANLYANLNYSNSNSSLLKNLSLISNLDSNSQEILVALSLGL